MNKESFMVDIERLAELSASIEVRCITGDGQVITLNYDNKNVRKRMTDSDIIKMYKIDRMSPKQIGDIVGVTKEAIRYKLDKYGVLESRPKGRPHNSI